MLCFDVLICSFCHLKSSIENLGNQLLYSAGKELHNVPSSSSHDGWSFYLLMVKSITCALSIAFLLSAYWGDEWDAIECEQAPVSSTVGGWRKKAPTASLACWDHSSPMWCCSSCWHAFSGLYKVLVSCSYFFFTQQARIALSFSWLLSFRLAERMAVKKQALASVNINSIKLSTKGKPDSKPEVLGLWFLLGEWCCKRHLRWLDLLEMEAGKKNEVMVCFKCFINEITLEQYRTSIEWAGSCKVLWNEP